MAVVELLAHEIGHFCSIWGQRLKRRALPGEYPARYAKRGENAFPLSALPHRAMRRAVARSHIAKHVDNIRHGKDFADAARHTAPAGQFLCPPELFSSD